jgi:bifunctional UDP-N-acetylglucosamine pyrophosphorylase/glucosamine-1-phosphate N-acetyltransferase
MKLASVILAGGAMHRATGDLPRMLLPFRGIPLLSYSLKLAEELKPSSITIVAGEGYAKIKEWVGGRAAVIEQREQLGSGQAVGLALNHLGDAGDDILVTYGDRIFLKKETLLRLFEAGQAFNAALLSVKLDQPAGRSREGLGRLRPVPSPGSQDPGGRGRRLLLQEAGAAGSALAGGDARS